MNNTAGCVGMALSGMLSALALACGVCIEDKVAATYDHAVVMRATARHQIMVFGEIEGAVDVQAAMKRIARSARQVRGIDRRSVRTSVSPPAFSFALDPAAQAADSAVAELQKHVRADHVRLRVLRVMSTDAKTVRD